jgi:hypothetical protein
VNYITHLTIDGGLVDQIAFNDTRGRALPEPECRSAAEQHIPSTAELKKWLTTFD